jgi:hypothetical protein
MSLEQLERDVRYLLDRIEIQDKITLYALGQDYHQPGAKNKNVLEEWNEIFVPDAKIDFTDIGAIVYNPQTYAELMRGPGMKGGGLEPPFKIWWHLEHPTRVEIDGDTATSVSLHVHSHELKAETGNTFATGYWHDEWVRTPDGWRIAVRRIKHLYFNTFAIIKTPQLLEFPDNPQPNEEI